uniref:Regulator of chromosome condensation 1 n=1 Tax=Latimeria chalumnae TaxID=7897 RepID=H3BDI2_LATCH
MPGKKGVKRSPPREVNNEATETKKIKISHSSHKTVPGLVLALGQGSVGQLGLGEDVMERKRPALVNLPEKMVQAEAGGMHTVCVSEKGNVYTFGCNDEGALGRDTSVEGSEMSPGKVELKAKVVQVSAGDSHTAALSEDGRVYLWGSFRFFNSSSQCPQLETAKQMVKLAPSAQKRSWLLGSNDHLVMLTIDGDLYSCGCGEQGQLGRVAERFSARGGRKGLERLLIPQCIRVKAKGSGRVPFRDVFCGSYFTLAISKEGHIYGFGLSNYHQLGTRSTNSCFTPQNMTSFKNATKSWVAFSGGQHHTVCLDSEGKVYSLGRAEYGRLGLGQGAEEKSEPTVIQGLSDVISVACGASVSYAVTKEGHAFAWGMGTNLQLGTGEETDEWSPVEMTGKQLENRTVLSVTSGGQHTVLLVQDQQKS